MLVKNWKHIFEGMYQTLPVLKTAKFRIWGTEFNKENYSWKTISVPKALEDMSTYSWEKGKRSVGILIFNGLHFTVEDVIMSMLIITELLIYN